MCHLCFLLDDDKMIKGEEVRSRHGMEWKRCKTTQEREEDAEDADCEQKKEENCSINLIELNEMKIVWAS